MLLIRLIAINQFVSLPVEMKNLEQSNALPSERKAKQKKRSCGYLALNILSWEKCLCIRKYLKPHQKRHFNFIVTGKDIKYSCPTAPEELELSLAKAA